MDSPFEKLGVDERKDWLDDPVTQAFIATLARLDAGIQKRALSAVKGAVRNTEEIAELGGRMNTFDDINTLLRRPK